MPELPEVEYAMRRARSVVGRTIRRARVLHRSQRRSLPPRQARSLAGEVIAAIDRRGKYQLIHLGSGRTLLVHFRLNGDWAFVDGAAPLPPHARVVLEFDRGPVLALVDSRALTTMSLHAADAPLLEALGPEAHSRAFNAGTLAAWFERRRGPVKPALLDQRLVAGVGNIYASEALWYAAIDPRRAVNTLGAEERRRLVAGVKRAIRKALRRPHRYQDVSDAIRFNVYDRAARPCRRCGSPVRRLIQAGRSTYYCAACQR
jgi:formamidopyrimidine-DNA glycosylase